MHPAVAVALKLNVGSGQRRFDPSYGWVNVDLVSRPGQVPDVIALGERLPFPDGSAECVVLHHVLEHFGCGEGDELLRECWRVLAPKGSLLVFVPDLRKLAQRWLLGQISDYIYLVNVYGAYQGLEGDRHKWGFSQGSLSDYFGGLFPSNVSGFNWRKLGGADIARDWWIAGVEVVKRPEGNQEGGQQYPEIQGAEPVQCPDCGHYLSDDGHDSNHFWRLRDGRVGMIRFDWSDLVIHGPFHEGNWTPTPVGCARCGAFFSLPEIKKVEFVEGHWAIWVMKHGWDGKKKLEG